MTFHGEQNYRMFSCMTRIKADWYNHLGCDRFDALLQIDEKGPEITNFDPDSYKPVDIWYDDKTKRLSSSSYKYPKQGKGNEGEQNTDIATLTPSDLEEEDRNREQETLLFTDV